MVDSSTNVVSNLEALALSETGRRSPIAIASALGWKPDRTREREIAIGDTTLDICRGYVGIQPASLFVSEKVSNGTDPINSAALYGYHAAVRWGLYADEEGLTPFNSHWLRGEDWFTLHKISWSNLGRDRRILEAFQPLALASGALDRIALERAPSPRILQPVDDEIVERLDTWRDRALKSSRVQIGVDEQLQDLFAKLFVLRTIEDRHLASNVPPLSSSISSEGGILYDQLINIFHRARQYIGSDLFDTVLLEKLPEHVISGVISDLYKPRRLPSTEARYNFSWIDTDVLGLAYEKYLSNILHPLPPAPQFDLFQENIREIERISVRRAGGVYYTPQYLTRFLANSTIEKFYGKFNPRDGAPSIPRVVDFSCGSGSFLVAAVDNLLRRLKVEHPNENWGRKLIEGGYINGIDVDEKAVTVARLNLWNRLAEEPDPLPLPNLSKVVVKGDGLDTSTWSPLPTCYDIVLGNPPFLATSRVSNREDLEAHFISARGRYDFSYLFVEQAINVTAPDGTIGLVIPNRLFRNQNGAGIRDQITKYMDIQTIVDFGSNEVFQGTSAYIGCLVADHRPILTEPAENLRVIEVKSLPEQFVAALLTDAEMLDEADGADIRVYKAQHPRGPGPWMLLSRQEKRAQISLSNASVPLSSIAGIFQGIKTGANDIFIVEVQSSDDFYGVQLINGLGDTAVIEPGLLQSVIYGTEVRQYDIVNPTKKLIYPYIN